mmetsp:Transcript_110223/g.235371  ORF Transcript_110223/g.235371 Transcript_110223/m.235371 type:complete len:282 (-) Transcript_110223:94-939(-)
MPTCHVSNRKKASGAVVFAAFGFSHQHSKDVRKVSAPKSSAESPLEHHQYLTGILNLLGSICFVVGSVCFLRRFPEPAAEIGNWLYIGAGALSSGIAIWHMLECYAQARQQGCFTEEEIAELWENAHYLIANLIFTAGTLCFISQLTSFWAKETGAWLFIVGSLGLVSASFCNALGIAAHSQSRSGTNAYRIGACELWLSMIGSAFFVVASFLYRPTYQGHCQDTLQHALCLDVGEQGTRLYIIGSIIFLIMSCLSLARTNMLATMQTSMEEERTYGSLDA